MTKKKILLCLPSFQIGGFTTHALTFGKEFLKQGHEVGILVTEPFGPMGSEFFKHFRDVLIIRRDLESRHSFLKRLCDSIEAYAPDLVINSSMPSVQAIFPGLPQKIVRFSVVHNVTEVEVDLATANRGSLDATISVSQGISDMLVKRTGGAVLNSTIPVGIDLSHAFGDGSTPSLTSNQPLRLISVGRVVEQKKPLMFAELGKALKAEGIPFKYTIIGDGALLAEVTRKIHEYGLSEDYVITGKLTSSEIIPYLNASDLFILTSHYEGTPHALLEGMAAGRICLSSRILGSTDLIVKHGESGFLCDGNDPLTYVNVIKMLRSKPEVVLAVSQGARKAVKENYDAGLFAKGYSDLLEKVLSNRSAIVGSKDVGALAIPPELKRLMGGTVHQFRHRLADLYRCFFKGVRVVKQPKA